MDFSSVNAMALQTRLPMRWFPSGKRAGQSLRVGNLQGDRGSSLWICTKTGRWKDHATGDSGGDLISLYAAMKDISQGQACRELRGNLPETIRETPSVPIIEKDDQDQIKRIRQAAAIWGKSETIQGTPAEKYLNNRGLICSEDMPLRYTPNTKFRDFTGPAMVALMTDIKSNEPIGIHRTFITYDGLKADIKPPKAMLGKAKSAVVKLTPDDEVTKGLGIVEGIENGLAILKMGWAPVWAALSANGIKDFLVLEGIECLTIFADNDKVGLESARQCARRWTAAGKEARICPPSMTGCDWNDVVRGDYV